GTPARVVTAAVGGRHQRTQRFAYDLLGRMTKVADTVGGLHEHAYDANGNPVRRETQTLVYGPADQLLETASAHERLIYRHDAFGKVARRGPEDGDAVLELTAHWTRGRPWRVRSVDASGLGSDMQIRYDDQGQRALTEVEGPAGICARVYLRDTSGKTLA